MAMRVFGVDSKRDEDDDGGLAKVREYNEYISSIRPGLPERVSALLDVSVHDSLVMNWSLGDDHVFEMTFVTENTVENITRISLTFADAAVVANDAEPIETLRLTDGSTILLSSEFDLVDDGRFRFQIMMTPTGELAVSFSDVSIARSGATVDEYLELGDRPNSGRWGREANAWLVELPSLHQAAALGQTERLAELLSQGCPVDEVDEDTGWTALHAAAQRVQLPAMEALLSAGANIDHLNTSEQTPLGLAARDEDWRGVEFLVAAGANVNLGGDGEVPLVSASCRGNTDPIEHLIAAGADPNYRDSDGWTVLMFAAEAGRVGPIEMLLAAGADSAARTDDGRSAADIARARGQLKVAEMLDTHAQHS
jgi:ankyrin repeat protein